MSDTGMREWREVCLQGVLEVEPDRRMAILDKLERLLRQDDHNYGPLWVDFGHAEVKRNGTPVYLKNLELRLLRYLIERVGSCVSRDELLRSVWGYNSGALTRTVDVHIHNLRQKLEQDASQPELIVTVKGLGYKFVVESTER